MEVVLVVLAAAAVALAALAWRWTARRGQLEAAARHAHRQARDDAEARVAAEGLTAMLAGTLHGLPVGVMVVDGHGQVMFRNAASEQILAGHREPAIAGELAELVRTGLAGRRDSRTVELFGPPRQALGLTAVPVGDGLAAVIVTDITEQRRLEDVRRDFVANVSHELKTPVGALGLLAETLAADDDPAIVERLATRIQAEAFRLAQIIDDLLELSRLEAHETLATSAVPLADVVVASVDQVQGAAAAANVELEICPAAAQPDWVVLGDQRQLVSAVSNLLDNAVKYSESGGTVTVGIKEVEGWYELSVSDHGLGIPARELDRVFERFYRVDRGRGRDSGGTGLGLAIVRHVATNHGGDVRVLSREGEGSTFILTLPRGRPKRSNTGAA